MPKPKTMKFIPTAATWEAAMTTHKGMVVQKASAAFRQLPAHWQHRQDLEDWIKDGVVFLAERLTRWNPEKGAQSTLVHTTLVNFYNSKLLGLVCPMRGAEVVSVEEILTGIERVGGQMLTQALCSEKAVQRLHKDASFPLLTLLDDAFFQSNANTKISTKGKHFHQLRQEFRHLAKRHGVTIDVYRKVIALHHTRLFDVPFHISR